MEEKNLKIKRLLESRWIGSVLLPLAVTALGALAIFGVAHMLSTERGYRELVREMHSKTFGNRWVAAYELSKQIASSQISEKDQLWLVENLVDLFHSASGPRTKNFIVVALGALGRKEGIPALKKALEEGDANMKFNGVVALGNMSLPPGTPFDWTILVGFLTGEDLILAQAALYALATHRVPQAQSKIASLLHSKDVSLRYSGAIGLINYRDERAIPVLREVMLMDEKGQGSWTQDNVRRLKISALESLEREGWPLLNDTLGTVAQSDKDAKVLGKAREVLNKLKNR